MSEDAKSRLSRQNARKKYVVKSRQGLRRVRHLNRQQNRARQDLFERQFRERQSREKGQLRKKERPLNDNERKELLSRIHEEKHPDRLREQIELARQNGLKVAEKDQERLKKMEKAREDMKKRIEEMKKREISATEKDALQQIRTGHTEQAMKVLKESGHDGALGNDIAENSSHLGQDMEVLTKETGKHSSSIMQQMLAEHSVPADTINKQKDPDKKDQNLEGIQTKKSTHEEMTIAYMKKIRGEAYGG